MPFPRKSRRTREMNQAGELARRYLQSLADKVGCPEQPRLLDLWRNWHIVMGEEIAPLCLPLGHKGRRLEVGTEDSMAMQELTYQRDEILGRANSFMDMEEPYFEDVRITLVLDRKVLAHSGQTPPSPAPVQPEVPKRATGKWLHLMDPDSPIARCYRAYCRPDLPENRSE